MIFPGGGGSQTSCHPQDLLFLLGSVRRDKILFLLYFFKSLFASGDFCLLLIALTNSLEPDQDRQKLGPDLDPNCLTLLWCS